MIPVILFVQFPEPFDVVYVETRLANNVRVDHSRDHPSQGNIGHHCVRVATSNVGMGTREPALPKIEVSAAGRRLPDGGTEGKAMLVQGQSLERMLDVGSYHGVYKGVLHSLMVR